MSSADEGRPSLIARPHRVDGALMALGVIAVSTSGPLMVAAVAPALAIAFWRNCLGAAATSPLLLQPARRRELAGMTRRQWMLTAVAGVLLAAHFATWVPSLNLTSVASATALVCVQPVWVAIIARARGVPVTRRIWLGIAISVAGAVLLTGLDISVAGDALVGDLLALAGGALAAGYVAVGEEIRRGMSTATYTTLCYSMAAVVLAAVCAVTGTAITGFSATTWWLLAAVTFGPQLLGHSVFNLVLRTVSSTVVSLVILFEIPGAALIAWVWLDQSLSLLAWPAVGLLLAGLALVVTSSARGTPTALPTE